MTSICSLDGRVRVLDAVAGANTVLHHILQLANATDQGLNLVQVRLLLLLELFFDLIVKPDHPRDEAIVDDGLDLVDHYVAVIGVPDCGKDGVGEVVHGDIVVEVALVVIAETFMGQRMLYEAIGHFCILFVKDVLILFADLFAVVPNHLIAVQAAKAVESAFVEEHRHVFVDVEGLLWLFLLVEELEAAAVVVVGAVAAENGRLLLHVAGLLFNPYGASSKSAGACGFFNVPLIFDGPLFLPIAAV